MAAPLGIKPHDSKVYAYRLFSLTTDGGCLVSRKVFTDYAIQISGSVSKHLDRHRDKIQQKFLQRIISRVQYDRLFPKERPADSANSFDLTLLLFLGNTVCDEKNPDKALDRRVAELKKLRTFRNEIAHVHSTDVYDETEFENAWGKIRSVILQLGIGIPELEEEIDALKSAPIDPRREAELQEMIVDLRRRAECAEALFNDLTARFDRLEFNHTTRLEQLEHTQTAQFERLESNQTQLNVQQKETKGAVENIFEKLEKYQHALMEQLLQIKKEPYLQLPGPGDFTSDRGMTVSMDVSQTPTSFHYQNVHEYTKTDERSGLKYVATFQQMITKGTVAALEQQDFEDLSIIVGSEWASMAAHLGISERQIQLIKTSRAHSGIPAIISEVVSIWDGMEKEDATIQRLIQAMLDCPMMNIDESAFGDLKKRHNINPY